MSTHSIEMKEEKRGYREVKLRGTVSKTTRYMVVIDEDEN